MDTIIIITGKLSKSKLIFKISSDFLHFLSVLDNTPPPKAGVTS